MQSLSHRYKENKCLEVWKEIDSLQEKAFKPDFFSDVQDVLTQTMVRVKENIDLIYNRLVEHNYHFAFEAQKRVHPPSNTKDLLKRLDKKVNSLNFFAPLSLSKFYEIVGGICFIETPHPNALIYADPLVIFDLEYTLNTLEEPYWTEDMHIYIEEDNRLFIDVAPDIYHKDNVSGGAPYQIELSKTPSIDSKFLNEPHRTTFIDYLRICFNWGGFPNIKENNPNYKSFIEPLLKDLKKI